MVTSSLPVTMFRTKLTEERRFLLRIASILEPAGGGAQARGRAGPGPS